MQMLQVDAISFTSPLANPNIADKNTVGDVAPSRPFTPMLSSIYGESFPSAIGFWIKFKGIKSLCIEFPLSDHRAIDNRCLFKWKVKLGNKIESFIFLSPSSIYDKDGFCLNGNGDEEDDVVLIGDLHMKKLAISLGCLKDVMHGVGCCCTSLRIYQCWKMFPLLIQGEEGGFL
ncbi:unnamed protein product [Lactuca virosa]|uniref:Uncharacterized protein n=1 Tax=Lactuca virosa TaxID=75947 RepID=A0AAU9LVB2_9ASTR|nr:unnamed protein product [Lactuca virosa]